MATAVAGDTVHVKAGDYGSTNWETSNDGNASYPIKFIGYTTTPNDIVAINGCTYDLC